MSCFELNNSHTFVKKETVNKNYRMLNIANSIFFRLKKIKLWVNS